MLGAAGIFRCTRFLLAFSRQAVGLTQNYLQIEQGLCSSTGSLRVPRLDVAMARWSLETAGFEPVNFLGGGGRPEAKARGRLAAVLRRMRGEQEPGNYPIFCPLELSLVREQRKSSSRVPVAIFFDVV